MKTLLLLLAILTFTIGYNTAKAQVNCDASVPVYTLDLRGVPDSVWYSAAFSRQGNCCTSTPPDRCAGFDVILDSGAAMVNFNIASGAIPPGSLYYQIECGPSVPCGHPICITGSGMHHITFCKPGNNQNTYVITSIPKPIFPKGIKVRKGCSRYIKVLGLDTIGTTWNSVYPGSPGQYNSYLSQTSNITNPLYTPAPSAPPIVKYLVCGTPYASACGYVYTCDTVTIQNVDSLVVTTSPTNPGFCTGGSILVTANVSGGLPPYTYTWRNSSNVIVGTSSTYLASAAGNYQLEVNDALSNGSLCKAIFTNVGVQVTNPPVVEAGPNQYICASSPTAHLSGSILNARRATWTGGAGTFNPSPDSLFTNYTPTPAELSLGHVILILTSTDAGGGCPNSSDSVELFYPPLLTVTIPPQTLSCNNSTANVVPNVTGGVTPYTYSWNNGATTSSITVGQGYYCVTVTDMIGCNTQACINITAPAALAVTMSSTDVSVNGGNDGTATANPFGGTSPYTYLWSNGRTTQTIAGLVYGIYTVRVTDANGCSVQSSIVVNEPRCLSLQVITSTSNLSCFGNTNGVITTTVSGGTSPFAYVWSDPAHQTTPNATGLSAGTYLVVVTDANGCMDAVSETILQPTQITDNMSHTNVSTIGGNDGTATANPSGGTPGYTYLWSTGATTSSISGVIAGTYSVTITDSKGCNTTDRVLISEPPCNNLTLGTYFTPVKCFGNNTGTATAIAAFGTTPYSYTWSNGATTQSISNLTAGSYTVTVKDATKCTQLQTLIVTQPSSLSIVLDPTNISCADNNDGTIDLVVSGGTMPYSFNWSNSVDVEDQINLSDGTYSVTVTDANGCTATGSTTITRPTPLAISSSKTNVTCNGGTNGSATISVSGGIVPYRYSWSNGATTQNLTGLSKGQYIVTVTDANSCSKQESILVDEPLPVSVAFTTVACPVPNSGVALAKISPTGGNGGPYQVSYDNGVTFGSAGDTSALLAVNATYQVVIKDPSGCISSPYPLHINPEVTITNVSFAKCFASQTSVTPVTVSAAGGKGGSYQISFDNGISFYPPAVYTQNLAINQSYSVVAKDSGGCVSAPYPITIPDTINISLTLSTYNGSNISCNGSSDGSITLAAGGGTSPYSFSWSNGATTQNVSNLSAGSYTVTVTDVNGCAKNASATLTQPAVLVAGTATSSNVDCHGNSNGTADASASGGTTPYTYSWNTIPVQNTANATGLAAGTYTVTITDKNNCTATASAIITEPAVLVASASVSANVSCNGGSNGIADGSASGGTAPYSYSWNTVPVQNNASATGLTSGSYTVTVTDNHGCSSTAGVTITEPTVLAASASVSVNVSCNSLSNGTADATANGGTAPYSYSWNTVPVQNTASATGLGAGSYTVTVTDNHGCSATASATVTEPPVLIVTMNPPINVKCHGGSDGTLSAIVTGGTLPYSYVWTSLIDPDSAFDRNLTAGTYSVNVTDANGCVAGASGTITEPAVLTSATSATSNYNGYPISCNGSTDGSAMVSPLGGTIPYTYLWNNGATTQNINGLGAGSYTVTVTDANGCQRIDSIKLTQPLVISVSSTQQNVLCNSFATGSIDLTVTGGVSPYQYSWTNGSASQDISGLLAGTYNVIVTDNNGCTKSYGTTISQTDPVIAIYSTTNLSCYNASDGAITLKISGGTTPYIYSWSNGSTTKNISGIGAGIYTVTITDANLCTHIDTVTVTEPSELTAQISSPSVGPGGYNVSFYNGTDGSINLTVNGGTLPYAFYWSTGSTTEDLTNLPAGTYSVIITDSHGCRLTDNITLTGPNELQMPTGFSPNADGKNDYFVVHGLEAYPDNELLVFNRWGNEVFYASHYTNNWYGTNKSGDALPEGTYFVVLTINNGAIKLNGYVDIRR